MLQLADGDLGDVGHQVVGDAVGILTDATAHVGTDGVEVTEQNHGPFGVGHAQIGQNALDHMLGATVGIGDRSGGHILLQRGLIGGAIDSGRGGEDDAFTTHFLHHLTQHDGAADVIVVVGEGQTHRFAHRF